MMKTSFYHNCVCLSKFLIMSYNEYTNHCEKLLRQGVMVREELEWSRRRQGGGRLGVMVVVMMMGIAEAPTNWKLLSKKLNLILYPL